MVQDREKLQEGDRPVFEAPGQNAVTAAPGIWRCKGPG